MQSRSVPSFFLTKSTGELQRELDSQMRPNLRLSSMNSCRVVSSKADRE